MHAHLRSAVSRRRGSECLAHVQNAGPSLVALWAIVLAGCTSVAGVDTPSSADSPRQAPVTDPPTAITDEAICSLLQNDTGPRVLVRLVLRQGLLSEVAQADLRHAVATACPEKTDQVSFLDG